MMHTLYGKGAVVFHDDKNAYPAQNGVVRVPDHLVAQALAAGFGRHAPEPELVESNPTIETDSEQTDPASAATPVAVLDAPVSDAPVPAEETRPDTVALEPELAAVAAPKSGRRR